MKGFVFITLFFLSCRQNGHTDSTTIYDLDNSTLIITDGGNQFYLKRCQVKKSNDTLFMSFSDTVKHSNWYELQIIETNNHFYSSCYTTFSITDSSYKPPVFTTYLQNIKLSKINYETGDSISGTVSLGISSYNRWPEVFTDTLKIAGDFRAIVQ